MPRPVQFGETLVIKGRAWPVIVFCRRNVRLSSRSDQNELAIGFQRSGRDGSPNFITRRLRIRILG